MQPAESELTPVYVVESQHKKPHMEALFYSRHTARRLACHHE